MSANKRMRIFVKSKKDFDATMKVLGINESNVESRTDEFFISVSCAEDVNNFKFPDEEPFFKSNKENVLNVFFDDVTGDFEFEGPGGKLGAKAMTIDQAIEVFEFISKMKHRSKLFIHCQKGVSRSGAIAEFIVEHFGLDMYKFKSVNSQVNPNKQVKALMKEASMAKKQMA